MTYYLALISVLMLNQPTPIWITDEYARISQKQCQENLIEILQALPDGLLIVDAKCIEFKFGQDS